MMMSIIIVYRSNPQIRKVILFLLFWSKLLHNLNDLIRVFIEAALSMFCLFLLLLLPVLDIAINLRYTRLLDLLVS